MLAELLRALMAERQMNQSQLAARSGLSQAAISRIVNGSRGARLSSATAFALADALEVDPRLLTRRPALKQAHK